MRGQFGILIWHMVIYMRGAIRRLQDKQIGFLIGMDG